ncbi:ClC family H(+)/Cl(-) exchange transporter [Tepidanaerobacter sp. GT38]|uniref:ClC family H(+)/Cl(-) exchange transporter n=1 Tax=Tepidanaerobacter sp. GT38 TaxID=2722793 RepID=UPI001F3996A4|nr:ClC family H(+)/Cl(-) exchange transporter [Tepidanaerobacter sp. GT38]MCG1013265.1 ClC family H(+)/Cl(-) exchange transporter [Tepidanaerobacter sp. GT38]
MKQSNTYVALNDWKNFKRRGIVEGIAAGILAGLLTVQYRYLLEKAELLRQQIYILIGKNGFITGLLWFAVLIIIGYALGIIAKKEPMVSGSGIPQVKGILSGRMRMNWISVILYKFVGGVLALGAGLSLGREGPSVQIGSAVGQGISRIMKRSKVEEKYLITCGASAGLAAAFNAPLAGVIFALEELHKNFSPVVLVPTMISSLVSAFLSQRFFGQKPIFNITGITILSHRYYLYIIILGIITGLFGLLFNSMLLKTQELFKKSITKQELKPVIPLLLAGVLGFYLPQVLGGGSPLIDSMVNGDITLRLVIALFVAKFLFTMVSYGSGVPGGIFLPLLVLGALTGNFFGMVLTNLIDLDPIYIKNFIILAMAGFFSAIVKAPITGSILITEMTGNFNHLLSISLISLTSYLVTEIFNGEPIYDSLLERALSRRKKDKAVSILAKEKIILEVPIAVGSYLDGKKIKNVKWDSGCLIVGIMRGGEEIIPKGETTILPGDYLVALADECEAPALREKLINMAKNLDETGTSL